MASTTSEPQAASFNVDFAATLARVKAMAAASLGGSSPVVPTLTTQEMREKERQIQEQKEVHIQY